MNSSFDLAVVGSGFAGALLAMIARRLGLSVVLLERERHPRFAIGESSTPLANLLLEELARRYELPAILPFTKWGVWQRERPDVAGGLKRGFTFYHHSFDAPWRPQNTRSNELLVAASPRDEIADTHWYRAEFDQALVRLAVEAGVELVEGISLDPPEFTGNHARLGGRCEGQAQSFQCRFVVDATGPRGFLARALALDGPPFAAMPRTQALFSHFQDVHRWEDLHATEPAGERPPYSPDDAAMHHVFPGGWIWVLRFNNGVTSAGVAATDALADELRFDEGTPAWDRLLAKLPSVREQFSSAHTVRPFQHTPRLAWRSSSVAGERWALLPSAAGFVDPLLSTGFPLTLLGVERLAHRFEHDWNSPRWEAGGSAYQAVTSEELELTADLVGALYQQMGNFEMFTSLALLYFAAASYSESARRLDQRERAPGFLLGRHPDFGKALRYCLAEARRVRTPEEARRFAERVNQAMAPINVAGLGNPALRNWYPARFEDLFASADKLGVDPAAIEAMLQRMGAR